MFWFPFGRDDGTVLVAALSLFLSRSLSRSRSLSLSLSVAKVFRVRSWRKTTAVHNEFTFGNPCEDSGVLAAAAKLLLIRSLREAPLVLAPLLTLRASRYSSSSLLLSSLELSDTKVYEP